MPKNYMWTLGGTLTFLIALVALSISFYNWNISALLRTGQTYGEIHQFPEGMILLEEGGYDGMLYYQIARDIPRLLGFGEETSIPFQSQYRYQRIALPLLASALSFGNVKWMPAVFLLINITSVIGSLILLLSFARTRILHALTVVLNPAMLVGILYSLTEPLSLFFVTLYFFLQEKTGKNIGWSQGIALTVSVLARETTLIFIVLLALFAGWKKRWREAVLMLCTLAPFFLWQWILERRFATLPLENSAGALNIPFSGPLTLITWSMENLTVYRLSALALLFFFILPLAIHECYLWLTKKSERSVILFTLGGLTAAMFCMDAHIWGVITSIGRVIAPVYGAYAVFAMQRDTTTEKFLSIMLIGLSIVAAIGIAIAHHPFMIS